MKNGMVIIDADGHAVDYEPVYRERLPEQYRNRATIYPTAISIGRKTASSRVSGRPRRRKTSPTTRKRGSTFRSSTRPAG